MALRIAERVRRSHEEAAIGATINKDAGGGERDVHNGILSDLRRAGGLVR